MTTLKSGLHIRFEASAVTAHTQLTLTQSHSSYSHCSHSVTAHTHSHCSHSHSHSSQSLLTLSHSSHSQSLLTLTQSQLTVTAHSHCSHSHEGLCFLLPGGVRAATWTGHGAAVQPLYLALLLHQGDLHLQAVIGRGGLHQPLLQSCNPFLLRSKCLLVRFINASLNLLNASVQYKEEANKVVDNINIRTHTATYIQYIQCIRTYIHYHIRHVLGCI